MAIVKYHGIIRSNLNKEKDIIDCKKLSTLVKIIGNLYGTDIKKRVMRSLIIINGTSVVELEGFKTKLRDNDLVEFIPITSGG